MAKYKDKFEVCVRAIIQDRGRVLVCQNKEKGYYYFPGGHIDFGEKAKEALWREIKEELNISIKKCSFIGTVENIFIQDKEKHHEINLVFNAEVSRINTESKEGHIGFILMDIKKFSQENVLPIVLKRAVLKWLKNKKIFWASQVYNKSIF